MTQVPYPLAMVLCDAIDLDQWTGRRTILGTLTGFSMDEAPLVIPSLMVYVHVSDGLGAQTLSVRVIDGQDTILGVADQEHPIDFADPLLDYELGFTFHDLCFDGPGTYFSS